MNFGMSYSALPLDFGWNGVTSQAKWLLFPHVVPTHHTHQFPFPSTCSSSPEATHRRRQFVTPSPPGTPPPTPAWLAGARHCHLLRRRGPPPLPAWLAAAATPSPLAAPPPTPAPPQAALRRAPPLASHRVISKRLRTACSRVAAQPPPVAVPHALAPLAARARETAKNNRLGRDPNVRNSWGQRSLFAYELTPLGPRKESQNSFWPRREVFIFEGQGRNRIFKVGQIRNSLLEIL
jgi:hypothetical protein